jgi:hypothetical protein
MPLDKLAFSGFQRGYSWKSGKERVKKMAELEKKGLFSDGSIRMGG